MNHRSESALRNLCHLIGKVNIIGVQLLIHSELLSRLNINIKAKDQLSSLGLGCETGDKGGGFYSDCLCISDRLVWGLILRGRW